MNKLVKSVFAQVVGKPFLRALVFPLFLVLFLVAMADATVNWEASRKEISLLAPWMRTAIFTALFALWCVPVGRALRPVWAQRSAGFLARQPVGDWEWTVRLLPSLGIALVPVAAAWWLASYGAEPVSHYLGFVGLCLPIVLGASLSGAVALGVVCAGVAILALLMFGYWQYPQAAYLGMVLTPLLTQRAAALVRRQGGVEKRRRMSRLSSSSVIGALVLRDLRCIVRTRSVTVIESLGLSAFVALMMLACRVNGAVKGRDALLIACVLFLIATVTTYHSLEIAKTRLGKEMMSPAWPLSYAERGGALAVLIGVLMGPSAVLLAVIGGTMGVFYLGVFALFVFTTIVITAALFARTLRSASSAAGIYINLVVFHGVLLFIAPEWGYLIASLAILVVSSSLLESGLRLFAHDIQKTERMNLLEVRELTVSFGKSFSVGPASFALDHGVLHIKGPNGGGKTTLMRAMSGGLFPSRGRVVVNNKDVHKSVEARRNIAFVSAIPELPDFLTVREAYQFTAAIRRAPAWEGRMYCEKLHLDPNLPLSSASAGQRQKAELVCGLAGDPAVLLLDENFAHLDAASAEQLRSWIAEWSASRLIIFTHHGDAPVIPTATLHVESDKVVFQKV